MNEQNTPSTAEVPDKGWELTKKIAKIVFRLFLLYFVICCVFFCIPSLREGYWKIRVKTYVLIHQNMLNEYVETFPLDEPMASQKYHGWEVVSYPVYGADAYSPPYDFNNGDPYIIQFERFGFGLAPSGAYAGMYYSPDDMLVGFQGVLLNSPVTVIGGNHYETEKICDHWYWYIAWF